MDGATLMWVVRWRSNRMSAPAFWYYQDEQQAREAANTLCRPGSEVSVSELMPNVTYKTVTTLLPIRTFEERPVS